MPDRDHERRQAVMRLKLILLGMLLGAFLPFYIAGMVMMFTGAHIQIQIIEGR